MHSHPLFIAISPCIFVQSSSSSSVWFDNNAGERDIRARRAACRVRCGAQAAPPKAAHAAPWPHLLPRHAPVVRPPRPVATKWVWVDADPGLAAWTCLFGAQHPAVAPFAEKERIEEEEEEDEDDDEEEEEVEEEKNGMSEYEDQRKKKKEGEGNKKGAEAPDE